MSQIAVNQLTQQEKAIEFVRDWSKWLIGLNFSSGTGCVVVLQQGVSPAIKMYLVGAILFFALSTIISAILLAALPGLIQHLPIKTNQGKIKSIYKTRIFASLVSVKVISILQLLFFSLGLISLFMWVILKPTA